MELQNFASGDTDYIAKLNQNNSELIDTITALQTQVGAVAGGDALAVGLFFDALFNHADSLIGPNSYKATPSATTLTIAPGGMYLAGEQTVVQNFNSTPLSFAGSPAGTYYVTVAATGIPTKQSDLLPGSIYSVPWTGGAFGTITRLALIFFDAGEATAARISAVLATTFSTLDARLEAGETIAKNAAEDATSALSLAYELQAVVSESAVRKIGCNVDGTTGLKGAIQIDFAGVIIGWSIIADVPGSITVEVSKKSSAAPPAAPSIPDATADKISASAPITLAGTQSAARAEAGVATWNGAFAPWDVVQFKVTSVTTLTRAQLYLRIQEDLPSPPSP